MMETILNTLPMYRKLKSISCLLTSLLLLAVLATSCKKNCDVTTSAVVVEGGKYASVQLPADTAVLVGKVESGASASTAYLWSMVSGPNSPEFDNAREPTTVVRKLVAGKYIFQLRATTNGIAGFDTASIQVNPVEIQTLTLQPENNPNEVTLRVFGGANVLPNTPGRSFVAMAISKNTGEYYTRMAVKFDLSSIPANAKILTANLSLTSNREPDTDEGILVNGNEGTHNALKILQISAPWDPGNVSWLNPPEVTAANSADVPSTSDQFSDVVVDVKDMVANMVGQNANYGFLVRLKSEDLVNVRCFVSSYNTANPGGRPKLVITYK